MLRKQTQFYIIEQLFRFFCSLFFPLLFFFVNFFLFFFLASRLKRQLHITIVVAVLRDKQNSPSAEGLRFVFIQSAQI